MPPTPEGIPAAAAHGGGATFRVELPEAHLS